MAREPADSKPEELFARALEQGAPDLDALVREHPAWADELRRLHANWKQFDLLLGGSPEEQEEPQDQLGPYVLLRELGSGGQGAVWLARDTRFDRKVAIKLLQRGFESEVARARFRREAEVVAALDHPNLAKVLDADLEGQPPWIAMPLVEGSTLADRVRRRQEGEAGRPDFGPCVQPQSREQLVRTLHYFEGVARALDSAHRAGVVHRDVKPGNLMVSLVGEPVLLDFGLASAEVSEELTLSGEIFGTPAYMAPEQWTGEATTPRTDVFSLGVTLFEAVTLERPFQGATRQALERAVLYESPRRLREFGGQRSVSGARDLEVVLQTAMAREPQRRYSSAHEFAEDLRRVAGYEPIQARPASPWLRTRRWLRREPALAGALVSLLFGLVISLVLLAKRNLALDLAHASLMAQRSLELSESDAAAGLALSLEALELAPREDTRSAVLECLDRSHLERRLVEPRADLACAWSLARDGRHLAVAYSSRRDPELVAGIWDLQTGDQTNLRGQEPVEHLSYVSGGLAIVHTGGRLSLRSENGETKQLELGGLVVDLKPWGQGIAVATEDGLFYVDPEWGSAEKVQVLVGCTRLLVSRHDMTLVALEAPGARVLAGPQGNVRSHIHGVSTAAFSGGVLWCAGSSGLQVLEPEAAVPRKLPIEIDGEVLALAADPAGEWIVIAGRLEQDRALCRRYATRAPYAFQEWSGHRATVRDLRAAPDGSRIASISDDQTVILWDTKTGIEQARLTATSFLPEKGLWTPDGARLLTRSRSGSTVHVWQLGARSHCQDLAGHDGTVLWLSFLDPDRLASLGEDGWMRIWSAPRESRSGPDVGRQIAEWKLPDPASAARGHGSHAVSWNKKGSAPLLWNLPASGAGGWTQLPGNGTVADADVTPHGIAFWITYAEMGKPLLTTSEGESRELPEGMRGLRVNVDAVACFGDESRVLLLDPDLNFPVDVTWDSPIQDAGVVDLSWAGEKRLVAACRDQTLRVFEREKSTSTLSPTWRLALERRIAEPLALEVTPDHQYALVRASRGTNAASVYPLWPSEARWIQGRSHNAWVEGATFAGGGGRVVTVARDGKAIVWERAELSTNGQVRGRPLLTRGHRGSITAVVSPQSLEDPRVATVEEGGRIRIWPLDPQPLASWARARELEEWERARERTLGILPPRRRVLGLF